MSFSSIFGDRVKSLWNLAHQLKKPIHPDITWTVGLINGRSNFADLQIHGIALMSSIIISEPVVPRIICAWDIPINTLALKYNRPLVETLFPLHILKCFSEYNDNFTDKPNILKCNEFNSNYVSTYRSGLSVNAYPQGLGLGYRAKYLGLNYVLTPYAIMSDIDTICMKPTLHVLETARQEDPTAFCYTNWSNRKYVSVGLVMFNMLKYRNIYLPHFNRIFWKNERRDSTFIPTVYRYFPELKEELSLKYFDKHIVNAEKFSTNRKRDNIITEDGVHYHAWKGEMSRNPKGFIDFYSGILTQLETSAKQQLK